MQGDFSNVLPPDICCLNAYNSVVHCESIIIWRINCAVHTWTIVLILSIDLIPYKAHNYVSKITVCESCRVSVSVCVCCPVDELVEEGDRERVLSIHTEFGFGFASSKSGVCGANAQCHQ